MTFTAVKLNDSNKCLKWQSVLFLNLYSYFSMYVVFVLAEVGEKKQKQKPRQTAL